MPYIVNHEPNKTVNFKCKFYVIKHKKSVVLWPDYIQCDPSGCIVDLTIQLAIILIGKQIVNNVKQIIIPYVYFYQNE